MSKEEFYKYGESLGIKINDLQRLRMLCKDGTINTQQELINVLESQVMDLSMMSKIELGDDVIAELKRLKKSNGNIARTPEQIEQMIDEASIHYGNFLKAELMDVIDYYLDKFKTKMDREIFHNEAAGLNFMLNQLNQLN